MPFTHNDPRFHNVVEVSRPLYQLPSGRTEATSHQPPEQKLHEVGLGFTSATFHQRFPWRP